MKNKKLIIIIIILILLFISIDYLYNNKNWNIENFTNHNKNNNENSNKNSNENNDINSQKQYLINRLKDSKIKFTLNNNNNNTETENNDNAIEWLEEKNIKQNIEFIIENDNVKGDLTNNIINFGKLTPSNIIFRTNRSYIQLNTSKWKIQIFFNKKSLNDILIDNNGTGILEEVDIRLEYEDNAKTFNKIELTKETYNNENDNIITLNNNNNNRILFYKIFLLKLFSVKKNDKINHISLQFSNTDNPNYFYNKYGEHLEIYFNNVLDNDKLRDNSFEKNICSIEYTPSNSNINIKKLLKKQCNFTINIIKTNNFRINIIENTKDEKIKITLEFILQPNNYITYLVDENKNLQYLLNNTSKFNIIDNTNNNSNILTIDKLNYSVREINLSEYTLDELNEYNEKIGTELENGIYTNMYEINRKFKNVNEQYKKLNEYWNLKKNLEVNYINLKKI